MPDRTKFLRAFVWPDWKQRKRILRVQAWLLVMLSYGFLVPGWLLPQDFSIVDADYVRVRWVFFMAEVFTQHVGLMLLVIALLAAMNRRWKLALVATPLMLYIVLPMVWFYVPKPMTDTEGPTLRVMSVNLLYINRQFDAMAQEILEADPQVLLLQEYSHRWHDALGARISDRYPYHFAKPQSDAFGAAIYSKIPFVGAPQLMYAVGTSELPQIRALVDISGRRVALYNIHLLPPIRLEYVISRHGQFNGLLRELADEPLPVVLAGDFNFPAKGPFSRALDGIGLINAHESAGYGLGNTWPVHGWLRYAPVPGIRIDHIYTSDPLNVSLVQTGTGTGSDHRPLIVDVIVPE